ncbi:histidine phosphatase family protein [Lapidilactobacillus bayanensis]|uniref:histidine phosphatase family protein n=1 Tax=Lapidilactobacillus bayanensis TaxID=2485998 RepID=UPI000F798AF9|nr:histidine phosphatase family protein [Lapidilactobacillus bayanensis]
MKTITVYLVRHGQTYFNKFNKMQGWSDSPLTPAGIDGAKEAAERLKHLTFTHAYSSDTTRAMHTCEIILGKNMNTVVPYTTTAFFREVFYGYFEGEDSAKTWYLVGAPHGARSFKELISKYNIDASKDFMNDADPFHDAETATQYWTRLSKGFKMLREQNLNGDNVLLVSHGTTIRSIVEKFGAGRFDATIAPRNASVTKILLTDQGIEVVYYNRLEAIN